LKLRRFFFRSKTANACLFYPSLSQRCRKPLGPKGRRFGKPPLSDSAFVSLLERIRRRPNRGESTEYPLRLHEEKNSGNGN